MAVYDLKSFIRVFRSKHSRERFICISKTISGELGWGGQSLNFFEHFFTCFFSINIVIDIYFLWRRISRVERRIRKKIVNKCLHFKTPIPSLFAISTTLDDLDHVMSWIFLYSVPIAQCWNTKRTIFKSRHLIKMISIPHHWNPLVV